LTAAANDTFVLTQPIPTAIRANNLYRRRRERAPAAIRAAGHGRGSATLSIRTGVPKTSGTVQLDDGSLLTFEQYRKHHLLYPGTLIATPMVAHAISRPAGWESR